jgi:ribosomal protein L24
VQKEAAIHISNVLPFDSSVGKAQRVRFVVDEGGGGKAATKRRVSMAGTTLHTLTRGERPAKK